MAHRRQGKKEKVDLPRREGVVEAALRVIAREGFEGATVRAIAREAGCTTGVPMHYFPTKDALLLAVLERIFAIPETGPMGRPPTDDPLGELREVLLDTLPRTEALRQAWRLWLYCAAQALHRPMVAAEHRRRYTRIRAWLTDAIARAKKAGQVRRDADPAVEAERLLSAIDGIATHAILEPKAFPEKTQIELMERHLEPLLR
jgi:AcrR family transcriptional regulator